MSSKKSTGDWGESAALAYYEKRGCTLIARGYKTRFGEIDLIIRDGRYVVFAEVKLRKNREFANARDYVTAAKRRRLRATAEIWLAANEPDASARFDVVEVYAPDGVRTAEPEIVCIEDAF